MGRVEFSSGFKKYFFNTFWLMASKVLRLIAGLLVVVYVARYLEPARFGTLRFSISFVALFAAFARLGLDNIIVSHAAQNPDDRGEILGTAFGLRIIGALIVLGLVFVAIQFTNSDTLIKVLVMIIAAGYLFQPFEVIEFYFQSQVLSKFITIAIIPSLLVSSAVQLILVWSGASLIWFASVVIIEHGFKGLMLCLLYIKKDFVLFSWRFRFHQAKSLLKDSWPFMVSGLAIMVYMRIDQVMIKEMLGVEASGHYASAVILSEAWYFVPMAVSQSLFPAILNAKETSPELYYARLQRFYDLMVWISISIALPVTFLSGFIITFLYGENYHAGGTVLAIHVWAGVFVSMKVASGKYLIIENIQIISAINSTVGAIANILLNLFLIPIYKINGAAISTVISLCIAAFLGLLLHKNGRIVFVHLGRSLNLFRIARDFELKSLTKTA